MARKYRIFEETYLVRYYPSGSSLVGNIPLWALDIFVLFLKICYTCSIYGVRMFIPPPMKSLQGETILITGAGHGIGRELAIQFAELGATVVCWDSNPYTNSVTVKEIKSKDGECYGYTVDVTARDDVASTAQKMKKQFIDISMIVSNAGALTIGPLCNLGAELITKMIEVNLLAHFWIIQAFLPGMIERKHGHIVAINSSVGLMPFADVAPYSAAKFGLRGLMESLSEELRLDALTRNIKTTSVYLSTVSTGMYPMPSHRFTALYSEITPREAAKSIIEGVRKNHKNVSVPSFMMRLININRFMPYRIRIILMDFFNFGHRGWFCFC